MTTGRINQVARPLGEGGRAQRPWGRGAPARRAYGRRSLRGRREGPWPTWGEARAPGRGPFRGIPAAGARATTESTASASTRVPPGAGLGTGRLEGARPCRRRAAAASSPPLARRGAGEAGRSASAASCSRSGRSIQHRRPIGGSDARGARSTNDEAAPPTVGCRAAGGPSGHARPSQLTRLTRYGALPLGPAPAPAPRCEAASGSTRAEGKARPPCAKEPKKTYEGDAARRLTLGHDGENPHHGREERRHARGAAVAR